MAALIVQGKAHSPKNPGVKGHKSIIGASRVTPAEFRKQIVGSLIIMHDPQKRRSDQSDQRVTIYFTEWIVDGWLNCP